MTAFNEDKKEGITVLCETCNERQPYPFESIKDAREYDRFVNDCVSNYARDHECIQPGARIRILSRIEATA